jgi:hypothetical protein
VGEDRLAVVGDHWEHSADAPVPEDERARVRAFVAQHPQAAGAEQFGVVEVPSGRLVLAHAWGDLSGEMRKLALPAPLSADVAARIAHAREVKQRLAADPEAARAKLATLEGDARTSAEQALDRTLDGSLGCALARLHIFGGAEARIRRDTGDLVCAVPAGVYAVWLGSFESGKQALSIARA